MNVERIGEIIREKQGRKWYFRRLMVIAATLDQADGQFDGETDELIADLVINSIETDRPLRSTTNDMAFRLEYNGLSDHDAAMGEAGLMYMRDGDNAMESSRVRLTAAEALLRIRDLEKQIKEHKLTLNEIQVTEGKAYTANDWLSDLALTARGKMVYRAKIKALRELSVHMLSARSAQERIRQAHIRPRDLVTKTASQIFDDYQFDKLGFENDGAFRKRISRYRAELKI